MNKPMNPRHRPLTNPFTGRELTEGGRKIVEQLLRVAKGPDHAKAIKLIVVHGKDLMLVASNPTYSDALKQEMMEALRLCFAAELAVLRSNDDDLGGEELNGKDGGK